jgi:hypothetical protein
MSNLKFLHEFRNQILPIYLNVILTHAIKIKDKNQYQLVSFIIIKSVLKGTYLLYLQFYLKLKKYESMNKV